MTKLHQTLFVLLLLAAAAVHPQPRQFGHVIFDLPEHFTLGRVDDYQLMYSDDDEVGYYATISVHGGFELGRRSPEAALRERMRLVLDDEDDEAEQIGGFQESSLGNRRLLLAGEKINDRHARMHALVVSRGWAYHNFLEVRTREDALAKASRVYTAFNESLRFTTDGVKPLLGRPTPGELSGAFAGTTQTYGLNGLQFGIGIYQFSKSGRFYDGTPEGGSLKTIKPSETKFRFPDECGNYYIKGDTIELHYATGEIDTMDFLLDEDGDIELDGIYYGKLEPVPDGKRFDALYRDFNYTSFTQGSGVVGGVASERTITLKANGRWEATSFTGAFGNFENGVGDVTGGFATNTDRPAEKGTYEIRDEVLILTDDTGLISRKSILQMQGLLLLDGTTYLDQSDD